MENYDCLYGLIELNLVWMIHSKSVIHPAIHPSSIATYPWLDHEGTGSQWGRRAAQPEQITSLSRGSWRLAHDGAQIKNDNTIPVGNGTTQAVRDLCSGLRWKGGGYGYVALSNGD